MRPDEVLTFDLGSGPELFDDEAPARFDFHADFASVDGRHFTFDSELDVESVSGFGTWQVYSIDDVARRLQEISDTLRRSDRPR